MKRRKGHTLVPYEKDEKDLFGNLSSMGGLRTLSRQLTFGLRLSTFRDICALVLAIVANLCRRQMQDYEVMGLRCIGWMENATMKLRIL